MDSTWTTSCEESREPTDARATRRPNRVAGCSRGSSAGASGSSPTPARRQRVRSRLPRTDVYRQQTTAVQRHESQARVRRPGGPGDLRSDISTALGEHWRSLPARVMLAGPSALPSWCRVSVRARGDLAHVSWRPRPSGVIERMQSGRGPPTFRVSPRHRDPRRRERPLTAGHAPQQRHAQMTQRCS